MDRFKRKHAAVWLLGSGIWAALQGCGQPSARSHRVIGPPATVATYRAAQQNDGGTVKEPGIGQLGDPTPNDLTVDYYLAGVGEQLWFMRNRLRQGRVYRDAHEKALQLFEQLAGHTAEYKQDVHERALFANGFQKLRTDWVNALERDFTEAQRELARAHDGAYGWQPRDSELVTGHTPMSVPHYSQLKAIQATIKRLIERTLDPLDQRVERCSSLLSDLRLTVDTVGSDGEELESLEQLEQLLKEIVKNIRDVLESVENLQLEARDVYDRTYRYAYAEETAYRLAFRDGKYWVLDERGAYLVWNSTGGSAKRGAWEAIPKERTVFPSDDSSSSLFKSIVAFSFGAAVIAYLAYLRKGGGGGGGSDDDHPDGDGTGPRTMERMLEDLGLTHGKVIDVPPDWVPPSPADDGEFGLPEGIPLPVPRHAESHVEVSAEHAAQTFLPTAEPTPDDSFAFRTFQDGSSFYTIDRAFEFPYYEVSVKPVLEPRAVFSFALDSDRLLHVYMYKDALDDWCTFSTMDIHKRLFVVGYETCGNGVTVVKPEIERTLWLYLPWVVLALFILTAMALGLAPLAA